MSKYVKGFGASRLVFFLLLFQSLFSTGALATDGKVDPWDSNSAVQYREPPVETIEAYKANKDYNYDGNRQRLNLFERILQQLIEWFIQGMSSQSWLLYVLGGAAIIGLLFLVLKILNVPFTGLFSLSKGSSVTGLEMMHPAEGYSREELDKMLQLYRNNQAYREAVRILYLMYLKFLHHTGVVALRINKTNKEYCSEIKNELTRSAFRKLSRLYDYVWYGQFSIASQEYAQIEEAFAREGIPETLKSASNG